QGILKTGSGVAGAITATSEELSLLKDNLSAVQFSSTGAAELASQAGLDLSLEGGIKYGARVEFDDGVPSDLVFTLGQQWEGKGAVDVLPALDRAAEEAAGTSISGEHSAKAQVGVELRYELPGLVGDSYADKLQNLLDGEVTLPKLPSVLVSGEATASSGDVGGLAKARVTLSPSGVPNFLKQLGEGDLKEAAQSLARATAEAYTFEDEEHFTDKGAAFGFGTAELKNSTRHLEHHATFDSADL
ncbi:MAG: hypothetical protein ACO1OB_21135, partial [Archangium sp.]